MIRRCAREPESMHLLYGTDQPTTDLLVRQCLLAERGVRFGQLFDAPEKHACDHRCGLKERLPKRCRAADRPIAARRRDLNSRGLLDDTFVLWANSAAPRSPRDRRLFKKRVPRRAGRASLRRWTQVNRAAIGAQVRLRLANRTLTRQVEAGTGEGNQNDLRLHFGLGAWKEPVRLEIVWPTGRRQILEQIAVDQTTTVRFAP